MATASQLDEYFSLLDRVETARWSGRVRELVGLLVAADGPAAAVGDLCEIRAAGRDIRAQVVGFRDGRVLLIPLEDTGGLQAGDTVVARPEAALVPVGPGLLGRVLDGFGQPMDGGPSLPGDGAAYDLYATPPGPLEREPIRERLVTGVRAIDSLLPLGLGQRVGIFGGSGVGKSTLLGSMARNHSADVGVIALIGERNREVREFIEHDLGPQGLARSVLVVATSDMPAPLRIRAAFVALSIAEYFRDQGKKVLLIMDSVTRLAMAQREIGLASGEPPSQKGYTPSVFQVLPKIFERAGNFQGGSITGFFTVLVEGDDFNEPICDAARSILDGHVILSRELGAMGHYPAIDVLNSVSRVSSKIAPAEQREAAAKLREVLATFRQSEDLINLGAYAAGANPKLDAAIELRPKLLEFLKQPPDYSESIAKRSKACTRWRVARREGVCISARRVLAWRRTQVHMEEGKLKRLQEDLRVLDGQRAALQVSVGEAKAGVLKSSQVWALEVTALEHYRGAVAREDARLVQARRPLEDKIRLQTAVVIERNRDARLMERLRERRLADWQVAADREIQQLAEELHLTRMFRSSSIRGEGAR